MHTYEYRLWAVLGFLTGAIVTGTLYIMLNMESGSASQGGRFYLALGALVVLGVVDTQLERLLVRLAPLRFGVSDPERRYAGVSLVLLVVSAVVLIAAALLLP
ncbi:MAG TPA: hypothetical protein VF414_01610 [Thermoanaerobaculia bacterium]